MCGEIQEWQVAKAVNIRLVTSGARQQVILSQQFDDVEEIRLDEIMITGFNGGVSGACYLRIFQNGMQHGACNNEANPGLLVAVDILNPHTVYSRPRTILQGNMVNMSQFGISLLLPTGVAVAFTEASIMLTVVCRRSADSMAEVRRLKATVDYLPSIIDTRTTFRPGQ
jgi:hypothetical protein